MMIWSVEKDYLVCPMWQRDNKGIINLNFILRKRKFNFLCKNKLDTSLTHFFIYAKRFFRSYKITRVWSHGKENGNLIYQLSNVMFGMVVCFTIYLYNFYVV